LDVAERFEHEVLGQAGGRPWPDRDRAGLRGALQSRGHVGRVAERHGL
jgi:hypothetical protein